MKYTRLLVIFAVVALMPASALASGFLLMEIGAAGTAQGGAVAAGYDDPTMVFWNPAHVVNLEGLQVQLGTTFFIANNDFTTTDGIETTPEVAFHTVPYGFITYKPWDYIGLGLGVFTNYGLSVEWPTGWVGAGVIQEAGIETFTISPVVSFTQPWVEGLSLGVGFEAVYGTAYLNKGLELVDSPQYGYSKIGASNFTFGYNLALRYKPVKWVAMSAGYRSSFEFKVSNANMNFVVPDELTGLFPDQKTSAQINLPGQAWGGVRVYPMDKLSLELDFIWVFWSVYDALTFDLAMDIPQDKMVIEKNWSDSMQLRFGTEYIINDEWIVRGGLIFDQNPIPDSTLDPSMPDNHRIDISVGAGYRWNDLSIDLSYMAVIFLPREIKASSGNPLPGKYSTFVNNISLCVGYKWPEL